jgi:hypothetical protein
MRQRIRGISVKTTHSANEFDSVESKSTPTPECGCGMLVHTSTDGKMLAANSNDSEATILTLE